MKVLYIHQYFRTPREGGSTRSYYLAKELAANGVNVEMITAHNSCKYELKTIEGIKVHYLAIPYDNSFGYLRRIWAFIKFILLTFIKSHQIKGVDICYIMTTPLTTGFVGLYNKWIRRIPYIFEVGDLWPEVPIQMAIIKNSLLKWLLYRVEELFYNQAKGIVALSSDIASHIKKIVPRKSIEIIPNIADCEFFKPSTKDDNLKLEYGIKGEFVISYTGTLGKANHLEYLLEAAKVTQHLNAKYLIVGDGAEKSRLIASAKAMNLTNVTFYPSTNKIGVKEVLNISDAIYLSFQNIKILHTGSPNKLFDGLAAGKVIISNLTEWTKEFIERGKLGICYDPESPLEFADKVSSLIKNKKLIQEMQVNTRRTAEREFSLDILSNRQVKFIESITKKPLE